MVSQPPDIYGQSLGRAKSGRRLSFPELNRADWFKIAGARKVLKGQANFLDRLLDRLAQRK
jgi:predicted NUDIX family NTP pyrophosphohydrolase